MTNAVKYTEPHGEIRIEPRNEGTEGVLTITDNGAGITPEFLPHVFELFVQSDRTLDRAQGGLGIVLSVSKRLVEMHGGRIRATSAGLGRGASFEIRLPLIDGAEISSRDPKQARVPPRRIFIVDDNADAADSLTLLLQLEGHTVECVHTSQHALERVESFKPDVVLLDLGLPEMNGYDVARFMRAFPE